MDQFNVISDKTFQAEYDLIEFYSRKVQDF